MAMTGDPDALQALIDADDQPVFALDRELRYTAFNQAHAATMRALYGVEIALGERLADYQTVDADRETAQANLERVLAGERVIASAYSGEPGRERRYFDIEHTPLTGVAGTVVGVCVHAYDVTERKRAEMALQASASERSLISANVRDVVFRLAVEPHDRFRFVEVNPAFLEVTGLTEDQVVGKLVQEVIPEPAHALVLGNYKKAVRTGKAVGWEEISDYPAGKKYGEVSVAPVYDADETCTHLIGLVHDVTERVRAEEELRKSEATLRAVLDATPFPVALVDTQDDVIEYWSRSALTLFGHTAPTAAKWDQMAYPDPDYRREVVDRWKPCLEKARLSGEAVNAGEYRVTCRDGSVRVCEQYATFLADRLVVTFNDVTERKRAEEEIRRQTVELATLNRLGAKD
jgi:PAS domain S-box-containing protein